jgi:hypothetical protein
MNTRNLVDPELIALLDTLPKLELAAETLATIRQGEILVAVDPQAVANVDMVTRTMAGPPGAPEVGVRIYTPRNRRLHAKITSPVCHQRSYQPLRWTSFSKRTSIMRAGSRATAYRSNCMSTPALSMGSIPIQRRPSRAPRAATVWLRSPGLSVIRIRCAIRESRYEPRAPCPVQRRAAAGALSGY